MNKCVLIDGNSMAFRAFYALPLLNNDKGQFTNAVYGFTTMLLRIIEEEQPTHLLVAFDAGKETFRHKDYKEYKGKRQKTPPELLEQFVLIHQVLDAFSIARYELKNYEADDIIGTMTKFADDDEWEVKVVTGDKDLFQLVSEHVHVALTRKGISEVDLFNLNKLDETYQLNPDQIIELKGLMGDTSDNIPGVPGVGEKTALKLLHEFHTIEGIYAHIDQVSGKKLKEKLEQNKEQALLSRKLATIMRDAPLTITMQDISYTGYDDEKVAEAFKDLDFHSLAERIGLQEMVDAQDEEQEEIIYKHITGADSQLWKEALVSPAAFYPEIMDDYYHKATIQGMAIYNGEDLFVFSWEIASQSNAFQQWLQDEQAKKWIYHAKRAQVVAKWNDYVIKGIVFDVFLAAYLIQPTQSNNTLDGLASQFTAFKLPSDDRVYGKGSKRHTPSDEQLWAHVGQKARLIFELKPILEQKLKDQNGQELFTDLELPVSSVLADMEFEGVHVDREQLKAMGKLLSERLANLTTDIHALAGGVSFNINSPKQLGDILFDKLHLPVIKKTKTGYSTNAEVLEKLEPQHEIIGQILLYRQLDKLQSTYVEGLLKEINELGKVHTIYQHTITATGRLSSTNPNLQNIPIRLEEGRKIRKAFVPVDDEHVLLAADYSQIELRILAHLAEDQGLIEAFRNDEDIHTKTAMDVFHVDREDVDSEMRRQAKAVNFGIVYGISDYGLSQNLNIPRKEAKQFIERYFASFPGVQGYMKDIVKKAKDDGYVSTILHRRRYLPEINSRNFNQRSFAERTAMNTPIQGTAADIIKKAMLDIERELRQQSLQTKLLLQVHDELIFEVPKQELDTLLRLVPEVMEHTLELSVPLKVDVAYGPSWYEAK